MLSTISKIAKMTYARIAAVLIIIFIVTVTSIAIGSSKPKNVQLSQVSAKQNKAISDNNSSVNNTQPAPTQSQSATTAPDATSPAKSTSISPPKVKVDPTMAWINSYTGNGSMLDVFTNDSAGLSRMYANGVVDISNGTITFPSGSQATCEDIQADVAKAGAIPNPPDATLNDDWQNILSNFTGQYKDCFFLTSGPDVIATMDSQEPVNPSDISNSVGEIQAFDNAVSQYTQQWASNQGY